MYVWTNGFSYQCSFSLREGFLMHWVGFSLEIVYVYVIFVPLSMCDVLCTFVSMSEAMCDMLCVCKLSVSCAQQATHQMSKLLKLGGVK